MQRNEFGFHHPIDLSFLERPLVTASRSDPRVSIRTERQRVWASRYFDMNLFVLSREVVAWGRRHLAWCKTKGLSTPRSVECLLNRQVRSYIPAYLAQVQPRFLEAMIKGDIATRAKADDDFRRALREQHGPGGYPGTYVQYLVCGPDHKWLTTRQIRSMLQDAELYCEKPVADGGRMLAVSEAQRVMAIDGAFDSKGMGSLSDYRQGGARRWIKRWDQFRRWIKATRDQYVDGVTNAADEDVQHVRVPSETGWSSKVASRLSAHRHVPQTGSSSPPILLWVRCWLQKEGIEHRLMQYQVFHVVGETRAVAQLAEILQTFLLGSDVDEGGYNGHDPGSFSYLPSDDQTRHDEAVEMGWSAGACQRMNEAASSLRELAKHADEVSADLAALEKWNASDPFVELRAAIQESSRAREARDAKQKELDELTTGIRDAIERHRLEAQSSGGGGGGGAAADAAAAAAGGASSSNIISIRSPLLDDDVDWLEGLDLDTIPKHDPQ